MESQLIQNSAPVSDDDSDIVSSPSLQAPVVDLRTHIIEDYLDKYEMVEDTPEKVRKHISKKKSALRGKRLRFDDPSSIDFSSQIFQLRFGVFCICDGTLSKGTQ